MTDVQTIWDGTALAGDWLVSGGGLAADADLPTAVILSLFTDARASDDDPLPDGAAGEPPDRRGWWGDTEGAALHGVAVMGSRLWLLGREKRTPETLNRARTYCREALSWLVADGIAARVEIEAEFQGSASTPILALGVTVIRRDGRAVRMPFAFAWDQLAA